MDTSRLERALRAVGERLERSQDIELLLVGGAAAMVTGLLPPGRTTVDCDVMICHPTGAKPTVEHVADEVAEELGLAVGWLNSHVQIRGDALPDGWERRRIWVNTYGPLKVYAASRPDLIAMKVLAGRAQDIEDLQHMRATVSEAEFVREYLAGLEAKGPFADQVADGCVILNSLTLHED